MGVTTPPPSGPGLMESQSQHFLSENRVLHICKFCVLLTLLSFASARDLNTTHTFLTRRFQLFLFLTVSLVKNLWLGAVYFMGEPAMIILLRVYTNQISLPTDECKSQSSPEKFLCEIDIG